MAQHQFGGVLARNQALFRGCAAQFEGALLGRLREVWKKGLGSLTLTPGGTRLAHASSRRRAQALQGTMGVGCWAACKR